jgi:hypothetical protein
MIGAEHREARDLLRARLQCVTQQVRCRNAIAGLLAQHNVTTPSALPALTQVRASMLEAELALLRQQAKAVQQVLQPQPIPTADVQRLIWIPGIGTIVAFTLVLEIDDFARFPNAKAFVSYCRLVPGAENSRGGSQRPWRAPWSPRSWRGSSTSSCLARSSSTTRSKGNRSAPERHRSGHASRARPSNWRRLRISRRATPPSVIGPRVVVAA